MNRENVYFDRRGWEGIPHGENSDGTILYWYPRRCHPVNNRRRTKRVLSVYYYAEMHAMKREAEQAQKKVGKYTPPRDPFWASFPSLAQYLSDQYWDDGAARDCPSLQLRVFADHVQLSLVDLGLRRSTETTAQTVQEGLALVDALCASPPLPWRLWDRPGKARK